MRTLVNAIPGIIAGVAVIASVMVVKFIAHRFIYLEEWSLAIVSLSLWGFGVLFRRAFWKTVRLLARTCLAGSLIACLSLIAVSFSDCFANGMAIRWLEQNGSKVYWSSLRSKDHGNHPMLAYVAPIDSFSSEVRAYFVPTRVFRSLNAQSMYWDLSQASQNLPRAIQAISQVPSQQKSRVRLVVEDLSHLEDSVLEQLTNSGVTLESPRVTGPPSQAVLNYLNAPLVPGIRRIDLSDFSSQDIVNCRAFVANRALDRITLQNCSIDSESAAIIAQSRARVRFVENRKSVEASPNSLDALISQKTCVEFIEIDKLSESQCSELAKLGKLRKLKVFDIDGTCLKALAALPPFPPYPGFASLNLTVQRLSPETVDAILTSCILCDLTAVETTSDFNSVLRLVESPGVFSFHLENQSQFPIGQQRKLRK